MIFSFSNTNIVYPTLPINSVKTLAFADLLMQILAYRSVFPFPFKTFVLWGPQLSLCRLSTFRTTPIADIKTNKLVEPAEMNGSGKPVGGIEPVTTAIFSMVWIEMIAPIPKHKYAENLFSARIPTLNIVIINIRNEIIASLDFFETEMLGR